MSAAGIVCMLYAASSTQTKVGRYNSYASVAIILCFFQFIYEEIITAIPSCLILRLSVQHCENATKTVVSTTWTGMYHCC